MLHLWCVSGKHGAHRDVDEYGRVLQKKKKAEKEKIKL